MRWRNIWYRPFRGGNHACLKNAEKQPENALTHTYPYPSPENQSCARLNTF
nr:MAG TPA: hypothetical protein [Myoviridae sp. ctDOq19]